MLITLLFLSSLLQNNEHRNVYLFSIGTLLYTILHWMTFSSFGDKIELVQKYRNFFYGIVALDLFYMNYKYKESLEAMKKSIPQKQKPKIEQVDEKPEQTQQSNTQIVCDSQCCKLQKNNVKDNTSNISIPVYVPNPRRSIYVDQPHAEKQELPTRQRLGEEHVPLTRNVETEPNVNIPIYESPQKDQTCSAGTQ